MSNVRTDIKKVAQERGVFAYGEEVINYDVIRRKKSSKPSRKVTIKVHPDQRVVATAPHDATSEAIQQAVLKRARWIWQSIKEFSSQHDYVLPRQYVSGETQFYLGRRYVLKVLNQPNEITSVKLLRGKLVVSLQSESANRAKQVKAVVNQWYLQRAKSIFCERLHIQSPRALWVEGLPSFRIMAMKKQWGSCSTKGNLMLNPHLVKAPKECIDYVILHELCHISEHNHSEKFWRLLTQVMPNWKEVKAKLDDMAELYLNE